MNLTFKQFLGNRIRLAREHKEISQTELAKAIYHSSPAYISFIENAERNISAVDLDLIAKYLEVDIAYFFGEQENFTN